MHFQYRNVNNAFWGLVEGFYTGKIPTQRKSSRDGEVMMVEEPVIITYKKPRERVLFNEARDCNPFFHLFESLWMLAGRNDVAPLVYYNSNITNYSDDGKTLNGAYGYRWRQHSWTWNVKDPMKIDQLQTIIKQLKEDPTSRRIVLQMWNVKDDLLPITKDKCCNTHAYFFLRDEPDGSPTGTGPSRFLDMTVCNRSNDLIWGMLGANVVHFSMLQEYLANCLDVEVGVYNQMTNNLHVYLDKWEPEKWLAAPPIVEHPAWEVPIVKDQKTFDAECLQFVKSIDGLFVEPFFHRVAQPMCAAFRAHKQRRYFGDNNALTLIKRVWADDWREAGTTWIKKRMRAWQEKNHDNPYLIREDQRQAEARFEQN